MQRLRREGGSAAMSKAEKDAQERARASNPKTEQVGLGRVRIEVRGRGGVRVGPASPR